MSFLKYVKYINVEPAVFLFLFGSYLLDVPVRDFVLTKICYAGSHFFGNVTYPKEVCENLADGSHDDAQKQVQSTVQKFNSATVYFHVIPVIFVAIFLGSWCDKGGRKGILILCMIGRLLAISIIFLNYMMEDLVIEWMWFDAIYEICGGEVAIFLAAYATISDESGEETRTIRILIISALWHISTALANLLTGYILQYTKLLGVMAVSATCCFIALLYVIFIMTQKKRDGKVGLGDIFTLKSLFDGVAVVFKKRENGLRGVVITIIIICLLCQFTWGVRFMGIDYYFVRAQYDWPELSENPTYPVTWLSQFYSIIDIPQTLSVFFIVPFLTNWLGLHDALMSSLGHFCLILVNITPSIVPSRNWWYMGAVTGIFIPTQTPALRALLSKLVPADEVGKVFAFQSVAMNIGTLAWPVISMVYVATIDFYPATVYLMMVGVLVVVLLLTLSIYRFLTAGNSYRRRGVVTTSMKRLHEEEP